MVASRKKEKEIRIQVQELEQELRVGELSLQFSGTAPTDGEEAVFDAPQEMAAD
jgi:hypothetical protein